MALDIIDGNRDGDCDIYILHLTDGDNIGSDNGKCLDLINQLTKKTKKTMYGELLRTHYYATLASTLKRNPDLNIFTIRDEEDINSTIQKLFE